MRKFFNGGFGLGITYWVGFVGMGAVVRIVSHFINKGFLTISDDAKFAQLELFHKTFLLVLCIYYLLIARAMIKAGFDNRCPSGWGWIGIALTITSTLYLLYVTATVLFPSTVTPKFMLEMEIRELNKQLPQDMGDGLVMTRVIITGDALIYSYTVEGNLDTAWKNEMQAPLLETVHGQEACQDFQGYFKGGISTTTFRFTYDNDTIEQSIEADDCLAWLAAQ